MSSLKLNDSQVWSMYWAKGERNSCLAAQNKSDQLAIENYWHEVARSLNESARVLDLACGNGAVAYALQKARADLILDAIDKSELSPFSKSHYSNVEEPNLRFHSNIDLLDLPTKFTGYDLICSQFGVEYAGLLKLPDVVKGRLNQNAEFVILVHHKSGGLFKSTEKKTQEYQALKVTGLLENLGSHLTSLKSEDIEQQKNTRQNLEIAGQQYLQKKIGTKSISGAVFDAIAHILATVDTSLPKALKMFGSLCLRVDAEHNRLEQMLSAAQSKQDIQKLDSLFKQHGFVDTQIKEFTVGKFDDEYLLAWEYRARYVC